MVEQIITYLNAKLATTGHFHTTYCLVEKKREPREDGDVVYPATYTGAGELEMVEFDAAGFAYFRKDGDITQAVEGNEFGQKQLYSITIPLRLVAMVRRQDIVTDDAYSPDRLARDIATLLTFKNGDLRTGLNANRVLVTAANWQTDPEQIWSDETEGTGRIEPNYSRAFIAMSVTVEVLADEGCIRNACEFDPDILHLFDFCKPSVVARLTERQVECLLHALPFPCEDATFTLINTATPPATLDSGSIPSGGSDVIVAPAVTVLRDGLPFAVEPSGGTVDVPSNCADATVELNGDEVATVASGGTVNIMVEQDGNPVGAFDPNTNSWVIPPCATGGSVSLAISDNTPPVGSTITLTATANFAATNYYFFARQGNDLYQIGENSTGVLNWQVNLLGTFTVFVQADDNTEGSFNVGGNSVTSTSTTITAGLQLWLHPALSGIVPPNYPDISGFNRNGTLVNSPTVITGSGGYVEFNGVNQSIENIGGLADFSFIQNTLQFTIGAWVYVTDLTGRNPAVANTTTAAERGFMFYALDTSVLAGGVTKAMVFQITRGVAGQALLFKSNDNVITSVGWNYVAFTMNGLGTGQFYLNGQPITTTTAHSGTPALSTGDSSRTMSVGRITGFSFFLTGRIAPVQIYNLALTAQEVEDNFDADKFQYGF